MKRCPECNRTYYDETLNFCLEDGASLVDGDTSDDATAIFSTDDQPTYAYTKQHPGFGTRQGANASATNPGTETAFRGRKLIWVLVPVAFLLTGFLAYKYALFSREKQIDSIAVLPFINTSNDPEME